MAPGAGPRPAPWNRAEDQGCLQLWCGHLASPRLETSVQATMRQGGLPDRLDEWFALLATVDIQTKGTGLNSPTARLVVHHRV